MPCRKDVLGWASSALLSVAFLTGCATMARREPAPPSNAPVAQAPPLAITNSSDSTIRGSGSEEQLQPPAPTAPPPAEASPIDRLYREAAQACTQQTSYICRIRRREYVNGKQKPEELMIFKCRAKPFSVHFKFIGDEGKGREVIYVASNEDILHILTAAGDIPLTTSGRRLDLPRNSLLVKAASKYPITEAGESAAVVRFGRQLDEFHRGVPGLSFKYLGRIQRPEYPTPLEGVEIVFPPNHEPEIPHGGSRLVYFDPETKWPVVSTTFDPNRREVDFICLDRFQLNVNLDDDDFNADKLWPTKKN